MGDCVGDTVGSEVVGDIVGDVVGSDVVGDFVGDTVGSDVVGFFVGFCVGGRVQPKQVNKHCCTNVVSQAPNGFISAHD